VKYIEAGEKDKTSRKAVQVMKGDSVEEDRNIQIVKTDDERELDTRGGSPNRRDRR
jgi:hypothetical protein